MQLITCPCGKRFVFDHIHPEVTDPLDGTEYPVCSVDCAARFMALLDVSNLGRGVQ